MAGNCEFEIDEYRKSLMEDYSITPEIVKDCHEDIRLAGLLNKIFQNYRGVVGQGVGMLLTLDARGLRFKSRTSSYLLSRLVRVPLRVNK